MQSPVSAEIAARNLNVPEGPVVLPDGSIAFVEQVLGRVSRFDGQEVVSLAYVGGAANAVTLGEDGLYAAQNGGVVNAWRSDDPRTPGIQRVSLDGTVETVATAVGGVETRAPNDLAFGPDGRLYFTDPAHAYDPANRSEGGKIFALGQGGAGELLVRLDPVYCNGIGFTPSGQLMWVESYERHVCRLADGNRREVVCQLPEGHVPDGFAVADDGRLFIATVTSHAVTVVSPDGQLLDVLVLDDDALPTNCCFDGSHLWVTDFGVRNSTLPDQGRLWRLETDATGMALHAGSL